MPFDFPASPVQGQAANGYVFDGVGWAGGGPLMAAPVTEQFLQIPAGTTNFDIAVPSWAIGVQIIGSAFTPNATNNILMRVSADGTTFFAGASDYTVGGPVHNTGSSAYANVAEAASAYLYIGASADNGQAVPHSFTVEMNLVRPSTSVAFSQKAYNKNYDSSALTRHRTFWHQGWLNSGITASLALKAIRIYASPGPFNAGSWVKLNWLGDTTGSIGPVNGVGEAPQDGKLYRRRNGVWVPPQPGEVLGGGVIKHATYASVGTTATALAGLSYQAKGTNSIYAISANTAGAPSAVGIVGWVGVYVNGALLNFAGIQAYGAAYISPSLTTMYTSATAAGALITFQVFAWSSSGTYYINGTSGGAAAGMSSGISVMEIAA